MNIAAWQTGCSPADREHGSNRSVGCILIIMSLMLSALGCAEQNPRPATVRRPTESVSSPAEIGTSAEQLPIGRSPPAVPTPVVPAPLPRAARSHAPSTLSAEHPPAAEEAVRRLRAAGVRELSGQHLVLFTDLPPSAAIAELPDVYDRAVPQWCRFFELPEAVARDWRMTAYLIGDRDLFRKCGALRPELPPFENGFQQGNEIWCFEQTSDYYRRHLLLHEGTHGFMHQFLGGAGPPWYMEGTAELLATHHWQDRRLKLAWFPDSRESVPYWGRIKAVQRAVANNSRRSIREVFAYDTQAHREVEPYAWCWAATTFLHHQPLTRTAFAQLRDRAHDRGNNFTSTFRADVGKDNWAYLNHAWQLFTADLVYGYDLAAETLRRLPSTELRGAGEQRVAAAVGWQSTGLRLRSGRRYQLEAHGRFQIGTVPRPWISEANGVTIRYHNGWPLGALLGVIVDEDVFASPSPFLQPQLLGTRAILEPNQDGVLYLCINDHPAERSDNDGQLTVTVQQEPEAR